MLLNSTCKWSYNKVMGLTPKEQKCTNKKQIILFSLKLISLECNKLFTFF